MPAAAARLCVVRTVSARLEAAMLADVATHALGLSWMMNTYYVRRSGQPN